MADLFDRLTYSPIATSAPSGVPSVDFAAGREAVRTSQTVAQAMDRISSYAFERAREQQITTGAMEGAVDPRATLLGLQERDPASFNFRETAAYQSAIKGLSAQVEVEAKKEMGLIALDAIQKNQTPQQLQERLDMATIGFSDSMNLLDPASASQLQLTLDQYSNAQFLNFSEDYLKEERKSNRAKGAIELQVYNESIENLARSSLSGTEADLIIQQSLDALESMLRSRQFSEEEIAEELIKSKNLGIKAKARGAFERFDSVEDKSKFIDTFKKDVSKGTGYASGMSDSMAKTLLTEFERGVNQQRTAINGEISNLKSDITNNVTSIVSKGAVVGETVINEFKVKIKDLEDRGGDPSGISELKNIIRRAEGNIEYFKDIQDYTIPELEAEQSRLERVAETAATADDLLRLKKVKSKLAPMETQAREQNAKWASSARTVGDAIDQLEKVVERFDPLRDEDLSGIKDQIDLLEADGAPKTLIDMLNDEWNRISKLSEIYNDIADDPSMVLEDKISTLNRMSGLSPDDSEILNNLKKRRTAQNTALNDDPLAWADGAGVITLRTDIVETVLSGDANAIDEAVSSRIADSNKMAAHYGVAPKILTKAEASALSTALIEAPVEQQAVLLGTIVNSFGIDSLDVMEQISKDAPELAHIGGLIVGGTTPDVIDAALKGRIVKEGIADTAIGEMADKKTLRMKILDGVPMGSESMIRTVDRLVAVADLIYFGRGGSAGGAFDPNRYDDALQEAAGQQIINGEKYGGITTYQKRNIIVPTNIKHDGGVDDVFDDIETMEDLVSLSVVQTNSGELIQGNQSPVGRTNGLEIPSDVIKKNYYLISVGDGLYKLANKKSGELAFTQNDVPFLIDLKKVTQ